MKILAHRGYWNEKIKKNSQEAIHSALINGFGFESDVRDFYGKMVISHDIADESSLNAEMIFRWLHEFDDRYCFAINIKADGLKHILKEYTQKYDIKNYFLFDMSVPQMVEFRDMGLRLYTRQSEIEENPVMYEDAAGVWIDGFWSTEWITDELLLRHIEAGKEVCLVSTDLHGKEDYKSFWEKIKDYHIDDSRLFICTDHPDEAKEYFNE